MKGYGGFSLPKDIVMISTADWDELLWTNKQQIASRLVPDFRVIYVEPLKSFRTGKRGYSQSFWRDSCGVHVFRPAVALPYGNKMESINEINHRLIASPLQEYIGELGFEEYILWVYTPNGYPFINLLKPVVSLYDCVDEYSAFPGAWKGITMKMEARLIKNVDLVVTSAESLYHSKKGKNTNTHHVPNVGDFDHFNKAASCEPAKRIKDLKKPVVGFIGALNYKMDEYLLKELVENNPDWTFAFVGPNRGFKMERFINFPNVNFLGRKPIEELPSYIAGFDVCIIPYKVDNYTTGVMPIKFFEYLASGKPVVSTNIPELGRFSELVDVTASYEQFATAIERRINNDPPEQRKWRIDLARSNSWETRIREILELLEESYRKKRLSK